MRRVQARYGGCYLNNNQARPCYLAEMQRGIRRIAISASVRIDHSGPLLQR
jgi:hypothetical protein